MHLLLSLAAMIASPAQAADTGTFVGPLKNCRTTTHYAGKGSVHRQKPVRPRKLAELPPANLYASVLRVGPDGCESPLIIRHDIGIPQGGR
jgi:hypothetical protein